MQGQFQFMKNPIKILLLIFAGEAIFLLPFVLARVFRPTFLAVFELTNVELGKCYSTYGIVALISYLTGGALADRYEPRKLMAVALILTAIGGFYMASILGLETLQILYGYWGFTTIFLFWSAMIKATRSWGGLTQQGKAFGFLEGGRGFIAASLGALGVWIFASFLPTAVTDADLSTRKEAFQWVIRIAATFCMLVGVLVYFFLQDGNNLTKANRSDSITDIKNAFSLPAVRMLMIIVLSAYIGYKITDVFSLYAAEIMGYDEVTAAKVGSYQMYLRPLICVMVGLFADRWQNTRVLFGSFLLMLLGALLFASGKVTAAATGLFIITLILTATGTYTLRAVYFAAMQEGEIPFELTGTAVGLISVIGYTPDIFIGPIMGYFLDGSPGIWGHQQLFIFLAIFAFIGSLATYRFKKTAVD